jgi:hypothetical protein
MLGSLNIHRMFVTVPRIRASGLIEVYPRLHHEDKGPAAGKIDLSQRLLSCCTTSGYGTIVGERMSLKYFLCPDCSKANNLISP